MANDLVPANRGTPPLVDAQGRPLRREELTVDIAGPDLIGVRQITSGHPAQGLDPMRLARILLAAETGDATAYLELAEEMEEKDLHYLGVLGTRKRAVSQLPVEVKAASDDPEDENDAQVVRDWLERDTLEAELFDILDGLGKGFSVTEIVWKQTATSWLPERLETRDPRWFQFDRKDGRTLLLRDGAFGTPLSAAKFIAHYHPAKTGLPIRGGLARPIAWAYMFRNYSMKDWVTFADAYGMPLRIGRYENGTTEANVRLLMRAIARLGSDAAAVFPKSMEVEFQDGKSGDKGELFQNLCTYLEQQISKAVLGQTATTDAVAGGLGSGQANAHSDVREDIERADAKLLSTTLNRDLVPWIVMFNRGVRERYPRIRIGRPEWVDVEGLTKALTALVPFGLKVGMATVRDRIGMPEPKPDEELLTAPAAAAPAAPDGADGPALPGKRPIALLGPLKPSQAAKEPLAAGAAGAEVADRDAIDDAVEESLGDWRPLIASVQSPIDELVARASSLEQIRDGLAALVDRIGVAELTEQLARAVFVARLAGDAAVQAEQ